MKTKMPALKSADLERAQIDRCLNCKDLVCNGECAEFKVMTRGIHRSRPEEIDERIRQYYPHCSTWKDLGEAVRTDYMTLRRHCTALGLDIGKFTKKKKQQEGKQNDKP